MIPLIYRAISNGNASELARWEVWNGLAWVAAAVLPTVNDDVYANGFTVTIDIDFFANSYRTTGISGVAASGGFILDGGITATGDVYAGGSRCLDHSASADSWVIGDSYGSLVGGTGARRHGCFSDNTGTLHIIGNVKGGSAVGVNLSQGTHGVKGSGAGGFIVYGDAEGGTGNRCCGAQSDLPSVGRVLGRATGTGATQRLGAANCIVNECASFNEDCIVTGKFIHDLNNNLQGLVNCKAQDGAPVQVVIYDESGNAITLNPIFAQDQADEADVRLGTTYANGALTGTLPPATTLDTVLAAIASIKPVP